MRSKLVDRLIVGAVVGSDIEPASRAGTVAYRGKLDWGWPEGLFALAERAGTVACRGKLDWGCPERLFVLAERAGTVACRAQHDRGCPERRIVLAERDQNRRQLVLRNDK